LVADGGNKVVAQEGLLDVQRRDVEGVQLGRVQPDAHGKGPRARISARCTPTSDWSSGCSSRDM